MWGARPEQQVVVGNLADIAQRSREHGLENPAVIIIGDVVELRNRIRWYDDRPLFGRRILVPRPEHQAPDTADAIRERGAEPVLFPLIEIDDPPDPAPLDSALSALETFDWVLLTSANGVDRVFSALLRAGRDARAFGSAKVGVIGPKTGRELEKHGVVPDVVAQEHTGEGLAKEVLASSPKRVLIVRALVARDALPDLLREAGAIVDVVAAYETRLASPERAARLVSMLETGEVDVVTFTSSSTVQSMAELLGDRMVTLLGNPTVASIGPITSSTLRDFGVEPDVTASVYTVDGLLEALEAYSSAR